MSSQKFNASDIKGLTPAIEPASSNDVFALSGRNYLFDTRGPKSAFGNRMLTPIPRGKPAHTQGFRLKLRTGDRVFTMDGDGIWEWVESQGAFVAIYLTPDTSLTPYRWTFGYLSGFLYFAHPVAGLLALNLETNVCVPHARIGVGTPSEVLAIAVDNGRLIAITALFFHWSEPSNGLSFEPSLGGGGFHLISDTVSGNPVMVSSYTKGCLTWTTGGVLSSEFTGDAAVYRHRPMNTEYRPLNSFCVCRVDDSAVVILDERGLFKSQGGPLTPFAPLFNEFLIEYVRLAKLNQGVNARLEWDELSRVLYLSASTSYNSPIFESCYAYYPPLDKWGQFNEAHYGIFPLKVQDSDRAGDYYGFADSQGRIVYWTGRGAGTREIHPSEGSLNLFTPEVQFPVQPAYDDSGLVVSASASVHGFNPDGITGREGFYSGSLTTTVAPSVQGLDSTISIGLLRPTGPTAVDEMSELIGVLIRSRVSGEENPATLDFNLTPSLGVDLNLNQVAADYGVNPANYINHGLEIQGTLDGITVFDSMNPTLVNYVDGGRYYTCTVTGVWHIVKVTALEIGESFHVRTLELTAISSGRLL